MDITKIRPHVISSSLSDKIFLFYGEAGTRKTSVASLFPDSIVAAFEIGFKFIDGVVAQPIQDWAQFKRFVRQLRTDEAKAMYKTVVIDTVTLAYAESNKYVLQPMGVKDPGDIGYGKGWRAIRQEFEDTILSIPRMGYGLVLIAHAEEKESDKGEPIVKIDIDKRPASIIKGLADFIFYTRKEFREGSEGKPSDQTVYAYSDLINIESKSRSRYFTPRFEFTFENLQAEMDRAIEEQKKIEGIITVAEEQKLHVTEKVDFNELKATVLEKAAMLLETTAEDLVTQAIIRNIPQDIRISELTAAHQSNLEVLLEDILTIEDRLRNAE